MAQLFQIRNSFLRKSGRNRQLGTIGTGVTTSVDGGTNGSADDFIRAGAKWLDDHFPTARGRETFRRSIPSGMSFQPLPEAQLIGRVYGVTSTGKRFAIHKLEPDLFLQAQGSAPQIDAMGSITFGTVASPVVPANSETISIDGTTFTFLDAPTLSTHIQRVAGDAQTTLDNAVEVINAGLATVLAERVDVLRLLVRGTGAKGGQLGNELVFTTTVTGAIIDGTGFLGGRQVGFDGAALSGGYPRWFRLGRLHLAPTQVDTLPREYPRLFQAGATGANLAEYAVPATNAYDNQGNDLGTTKINRVPAAFGIEFAPIPATAFTLEVEGRFYSADLTNNTDENYWSAAYPDLLVWAALYQFERSNRNDTGSREWLAALNEWGKQVVDHEAEQEMEEEDMRMIPDGDLIRPAVARDYYDSTGVKALDGTILS